MSDFKLEECYQIDDKNTCERIDKYLSTCLAGVSRSEIQHYIKNGFILVNDKTVSKNYKLAKGDVVKVEVPNDKEKEALVGEDMNLDIVYEDDDVLVVNKVKGILVHPTEYERAGTLVNGLIFHTKGNLSKLAGENRPGIVHRIDKDTSGLLVVAKSDEAYYSLSDAFQSRNVMRKYKALLSGHISPDEGIIDYPIARSKSNTTKMAVVREGEKAITKYKVLEEFKNYTLVEAELVTGKTHQIRVHMAHKNCPIAGDKVYKQKISRREEKLNGQCLHSYKVGFTHPTTMEYMEFETELPTYFTDFMSDITTDN